MAIVGRPHIIYQGKRLEAPTETQGGKNKGGFYHELLPPDDKKGQEYFVKKPADQKELFTELFAGKILEQFVRHKIVDEKLIPYLIYADTIQFPDKSYGLIQPKRKFKELFKHIYEGTDRASAVDRDAKHDVFSSANPFAVNIYRESLDRIKHENLAVFLMLSIVLGDYSVHSGNMVLMQNEDGAEHKEEDSDDGVLVEAVTFKMTRIDYGASFRDYGAESNRNILYPSEYSGMGVFKLLTKNYLANFFKVPNLFDNGIPREAVALMEKLGNEEAKKIEKLKAILLDAIKTIPVDLIADEKTRTDLARYMALPSFERACRVTSNTKEPPENKSDNEKFAEELAGIMYGRINAITELLTPAKRAELEAAGLRTQIMARTAERDEAIKKNEELKKEVEKLRKSQEEIESKGQSDLQPKLALGPHTFSDSKRVNEEGKIAPAPIPTADGVAYRTLPVTHIASHSNKCIPQSLRDVIFDTTYWKSKSKFSCKIPDGIKLLREAILNTKNPQFLFDKMKEIASKRAGVKSWTYLLFGYNNRDLFTENLYRVLRDAKSFGELVDHDLFKSVETDRESVLRSRNIQPNVK